MRLILTFVFLGALITGVLAILGIATTIIAFIVMVVGIIVSI